MDPIDRLPPTGSWGGKEQIPRVERANERPQNDEAGGREPNPDDAGANEDEESVIVELDHRSAAADGKIDQHPVDEDHPHIDIEV